MEKVPQSNSEEPTGGKGVLSSFARYKKGIEAARAATVVAGLAGGIEAASSKQALADEFAELQRSLDGATIMEVQEGSGPDHERLSSILEMLGVDVSPLSGPITYTTYPDLFGKAIGVLNQELEMEKAQIKDAAASGDADAFTAIESEIRQTIEDMNVVVQAFDGVSGLAKEFIAAAAENTIPRFEQEANDAVAEAKASMGVPL